MYSIFYILLLLTVYSVKGVKWENIRCSADTVQEVPEGNWPDVGRFPWLGIVQHNFYIGGANRFAITSGILIHPIYAIAPAEDIARIQPGSLTNNTQFIVWQSATNKYVMPVTEYFLHSEFEKITYATIAMLQLNTRGKTGLGEVSAPVLPICMPIKGGGVFEDFYTVKMTDEKAELSKQVIKMKYVENQDCEEFYYRAKLNHKKMAPVSAICAVSETLGQSCIWDAGSALITRQSWGYWKLLGFGTRGPGCAAPARYLNIHQYLGWIDEVISQRPLRERFDEEGLIFRRVSPVKLVMYKGNLRHPKSHGQCDRKDRGNVLYKDSSEVLVNKNFAQGFFFLSLAQAASVRCATIYLDVSSRTNAAVWLEHHCHKELMGHRQGYKFRHINPDECFVYFTSVAFIEFRFYFSFKAVLEVTLYGSEEEMKISEGFWAATESTYAWWPTYTDIRSGGFVPRSSWYWYM
ncbi:unnamed protein product [Pieris macdunnoughi]|uniref:Peptidase S1 domain-containing protein n=1 Tax=Pieris macdunnoughi TaxID=345717 RepID=A0A821WKY7_9NEOP|nr:unnamed protein product [Pieris macdunnoughi]